MSPKKQYEDVLIREKRKARNLCLEILGFKQVNRDLLARVDQLQEQLDKLKNIKWWQIVKLIKLLRS